MFRKVRRSVFHPTTKTDYTNLEHSPVSEL